MHRNRAATLVVAASVLIATVPSAAQGARHHGGQRNYAGAAWTTPHTFGLISVSNHMKLSSARVRDARSGGFIAQTLWMTTRGGDTPFGRNKRSAYVQVGITKGHRGSDKVRIFAAQLRPDGKYIEGATPSGGAAALEQENVYAISGDFGGYFRIKLNHDPDPIITFKGGGGGFGARSAYSGIESTSSRNSARGEVSELGALQVPYNLSTVSPTFGWENEDAKSRLIKRGPGSVRWTKKFFGFTNSFGN